jgi:pyruvate-ferredoxin/flavodoxin oxidoreductase
MHELYDCHEPSFTNEGLGSQNLPCQTGTNQNSDAYFQNTEARNPVYEKSLKQIKSVLQKFNKLVGRKYGIFDYVGVKNPNLVFVIMGSGADTVEETVKLLNTTYKQKVGVIKVRFYRPFFSEEFVKTIPVSTKKIIVLDRTKEFGADGEPLFKDVVFAISQYCDKKIKVCGGRYGLGGKNFDIQDTLDIYENMVSAKPVNNFSIGIVDDVNHTSIPKAKKYLALSDEGVRVYGLGSDGTLSACKIIVNIAGTTTNKFVQAFFEYDSKKSGSLTVSHLRFSPSPITQHFYVKNPSVVQINNFRYVFLPNVLNGIKEEGTVILNTSFNKELLNLHLPEEFKKVVITKKLKLYTINAFEVANRNKLDKKINIIMMACFLKITNYIDYLDASRSIIEKIKTTFFSKGEEVIQNNIKAFQESTESLTFVDYREFVGHKTKKQTKQEAGISNKYYAFLQKFVNKQGDELPVSAFKNSLDGKVFPTNFFPETKSSFEQLPI